MDIRYSCNQKDFKRYTTEEMRDEMLITGLYKADEVVAVYSHVDRMVTLGCMPVHETVSIDKGIDVWANFGTHYFLERREIGIFNIGKDSTGIVVADGVKYELHNPVNVHVNYATTTEYKNGQLTSSTADNNDVTKALLAANGDAIKLVLNEGEVTDIYVTETKLGVVTAKSSEKVTISGLGTITIKDHDVYEDIAKNDVVTYTRLYNDSDLDKAFVTVNEAEVISGTVKGFKDTESVNLDGTTYDVDKETLTTTNFGSDAVADFSDAIGEDFDLYLVNGMVAVAIQTSESASNYSLVTSVSGTSDKPGDTLNGLRIEVLGADGTKKVLNVSEDSTQADDSAIESGDDITKLDIVTYSINKDGDADVHIEASVGSDDAKYVKKTKPFDGITTSSDCVLFASTTATGSYKAYKIRDLNDLNKEGDSINMNVVGCATYAEAEEIAKEMVAKGCTAIELCAGFGNEGIARIKRAVGPGIAVGAVKFDFHPAFGFKSGDEMFG